ncbi:MFS transporter [Leptolyngbya sp. PCC 6406]|uniref:MFS transporter n=1 Tax=Leptolyngbya sp. PCC 6406 TaxID=1173264 RepID=UPI0002ACABCD|nr:MFS transporter [Leptolyngbya sp. PCC 6406]
MLSQLGIGFVLFYAPIFFVSQVGLSATQVGLGIGSEALSGLVGRFLGGSMADSPRWGRRKTLLISALISALADGVLLLTHDFPTFVMGNLLMGLGVGLYWPSTEAVVADITPSQNRNEAFALVRTADNLGLGSGVVLGGILISTTASYRLLFAMDGITFLLFFVVIYAAIAETLPPDRQQRSFLTGWGTALRDRSLLIYAAVNIGFTSYIAQTQSTLPLYLNRFVPAGDFGIGLPEVILSGLFAGHVALTVICQLPMVHALKGLSQPRSLMLSAVLWGITFTLIWGTGKGLIPAILGAALALTTASLATAAHTPVASSLVVTLAPETLRGVYLSINSMCWAMGYFIGPPLGGWALDQPRAIADGFWLVAALSIFVAIAVLVYLERCLQTRSESH